MEHCYILAIIFLAHIKGKNDGLGRLAQRNIIYTQYIHVGNRLDESFVRIILFIDALDGQLNLLRIHAVAEDSGNFQTSFFIDKLQIVRHFLGFRRDRDRC